MLAMLTEAARKKWSVFIGASVLQFNAATLHVKGYLLLTQRASDIELTKHAP